VAAVLKYDESQLAVDVAALLRAGRAVFAALCAERLLPLYGRFNDESGNGNPAQLAAALETVWLAIDGSASTSDLSAAMRKSPLVAV
jgi:hypothetical protein